MKLLVKFSYTAVGHKTSGQDLEYFRPFYNIKNMYTLFQTIRKFQIMIKSSILQFFDYIERLVTHTEGNHNVL